ncbi:MAG: PIN domain-containing protein [Lachnospiraceae bacterium]|nr:PIN domain-containing protein [Lachnospiraceae bacterium]
MFLQLLQTTDPSRPHFPSLSLCHKSTKITSTTSITYAELSHGVEKSSYPEKNRLALILFLTAIQVLPFDAEAAEEYGTIRASLEKQGTPIGPMDLLIAAHAKARGLVVVTNNVREFSRVNNLQLEDWSAH